MKRADHYLLRDPVGFAPIVAIALGVLFLATVLSQTRVSRSSVSLAIGDAASRAGAHQGHVPVLTVAPEEKYSIEGLEFSGRLELERRLSLRGGERNALVLRPDPGLSANGLSEALQSCAAAGYTSVYVERPPAPERKLK